MKSLDIPFKMMFTHASATRSRTTSVWVEALAGGDGKSGYGEGCPRNYVTGEDIESAFKFFVNHRDSIVDEITCVITLRDWVERNERLIDANPSAWCSIELALLDLLGRVDDKPLEILGLQEIVWVILHEIHIAGSMQVRILSLRYSSSLIPYARRWMTR
ncbi:MAG: hypothetical protein IDH49_13415, partial [Gammaproteobacteria bacterium]|nr:hypothetical protein [Gammaproteobacteria bacterium]